MFLALSCPECSCLTQYSGTLMKHNQWGEQATGCPVDKGESFLVFPTANSFHIIHFHLIYLLKKIGHSVAIGSLLPGADVYKPVILTLEQNAAGFCKELVHVYVLSYNNMHIRTKVKTNNM